MEFSLELSESFVKALHIIFVVTWFSGLFYIVRLFIYHVETKDLAEPKKSILSEQYSLMEKRLWYIITWPSMLLTITFGIWMLSFRFGYYMKEPWMHLKLGFVGLLLFYHIGCQHIYNRLQKDDFRYNSMQLRIWNEVATLLLFIIVFLVVYQRLDAFKGILGFAVFGALLFEAVKLYKRKRIQDEKELQDESVSEEKEDAEIE